MPLLSDDDLGLATAPTAAPSRLLTDEEALRPHPPLYFGPGGRALTRPETQALYAQPPRQEPTLSFPEKIATAIQRVNDNPVGAFSESVGKLAGKVGVPNSEAFGRDIYAGINSLGPLGAEFAPMPQLRSAEAVAPRVASSVEAAAAIAPKRLLTDAEVLQGRLNALAPQSENVFTSLQTPKRLLSDDDILGPAQDHAGNINLHRIQAPEDVHNVIREVAKGHANFTDARRGTMTFDDIRELAPMVGMTPEKLAGRGIGKTFNAEEMFAARRLLVTQADEVRSLAKTAHGGSDADKFDALQAITRLAATQEQVAGATAEAGRLLGQFRMLASARRDSDTIRRILDTSGGRLDDMIEGIAKMGDAPPEVVAGFVKKSLAAKTSDMLLEGWINSLLSGPVTHATNALSNALVAAWQIPEALTTATISKVTGSGVTYREALSRSFGLVEGAKEGLRAAYRAFLTEEPSGFAGKIEQTKYQAIPSKTFRAGQQRKTIFGAPIPLTGEIQVGGRQVRIPGRALMASDEFFKAINYRAEINAQALRQAMAEGKRGPALAQRVTELKSAPTDELTAKAREAAEKQTFTNPLGKFGKGLQAMASDAPVTRVVMPFIRTPVNIVKYAAERSPFAPLFKHVRENLSGAKGPAARDEQIARITLGSTVGAVTASYAVDGTITGGGPASPQQRAALYATGWQPYSIKIGNTYYSFGRLEPLGTLLGVSADFVELSKAMNDQERNGIAALIMGSISKNLVSKTWLRGPAELIEAVQDPDRYGETYVRNLVGTIVPTGVAQLARTRDPYLREARSILDKIKDRVPGYRETLPLRRDVFGEPIKLEGALGPDIISPIYTSSDTNDPVAREMVRLGMAPSRVTRNIRGVDLQAPEYEAFQKNAGQLAKTMLQRLISSPEYAGLSDEAKRDLLDEVMRKTRDVGRAQTVQQFPDIALREALMKQQKAERLRPGGY
jgi:hypothetical protein